MIFYVTWRVRSLKLAVSSQWKYGRNKFWSSGKSLISKYAFYHAFSSEFLFSELIVAPGFMRSKP